MKRIVLWFLSTLSALVLLFGYHTSTSSTSATSAPTSIVAGSTSNNSSSRGSNGTNSSENSSSGSGNGSSNGSSSTSTVTGSAASTQWGPVQVEIALKGSTITKVNVLQQPSGNPTDTEINARALPVLIQETLQQQSSQIDMVSGATVTSTGYLQSLQNAIDEANA